jgi:hypothetical protein
MLFSAILGSVFGIMGAIGGVMEFIEKKAHSDKREFYRKQRFHHVLETMSKHANHKISRPVSARLQGEDKSSETKSKEENREKHPLIELNQIILRDPEPSVDGVLVSSI